MRLLLAILLFMPLAAQDTSSQKEQSPAPVAEQWLTGDIDFGYRWVGDIGGNLDSYRSVVNLGDGPKLFGLDLTLKDPSRRAFDKMNVRANSWGGDPYNTAHMDVQKERLYNLSLDYRNIIYFNALPSFANPLLDQGILFNERSFDLHRRLFDAQLDLLPGSRIIPYVAYSRDSGDGHGITNFIADGNEYPVGTNLRDKTDQYRGGVRVELNRFHVTLEQGGTTFKDDQRAYTRDQNLGNRQPALFGQRLYLSSLEQAYGVRGDSLYSKALLTANPAPWIDVYGQFLYSVPHTDVHYAQDNAGLFFSFQDFTFFNAQNVLATSEAKQPHTSGSFGFELRPHRRVRILESWMTDRFHTTGAAVLRDLPDITSTGATRLVLKYNRQELNILVDLTPKVTLRGGHRYVWGQANVPAPTLSQRGSIETGETKMHVALAGVSVRPSQKLSFHFDFEGSSADRSYFRTSLHDYRKGRARANYQVLSSLLLSADFQVLSNQNPSPNVRYDFLTRDNTISAYWSPGGGKRFTLLADYTRSTFRTDLSYLVPNTLQPARSFYRENAHNATAVLDVNLPSMKQGAPKLSLGGSLFSSSGSRPTRYYQPLGRISVPLCKKGSWFAEWRWYSLGEPFYLFEGFRTHQFITGLRLAL